MGLDDRLGKAQAEKHPLVAIKLCRSPRALGEISWPGVFWPDLLTAGCLSNRASSFGHGQQLSVGAEQLDLHLAGRLAP